MKALKSITTAVHVSEYKGGRVAIDALGWLHRGTYACSKDLLSGVATTKHIDFFMSMIQMIKSHEITPYVVFDGKSLLAKQDVHNSR